jgi:predicted 2-oxoglutarate/Fe(II)-dependent dioxygenase YbiX
VQFDFETLDDGKTLLLALHRACKSTSAADARDRPHLHPKVNGKIRALNLIAFLNPEWQEFWGGALCLCDPMGNVVKKIYPTPGRLVAFECSDLSYHSVERITGPHERVTLAVYFLTDATGQETRRRALFMPTR